MVTQAVANVSTLRVKLNGSDLTANMANALDEVEVQNDLRLPDVATIRFHLFSPAGKTTEIPDTVIKDYLNKGAEVEISQRLNNSDKPIFKGEVVSVGLEYSEFGPGSPMFAVVQAYNKAHRLHRGRKTRTFLNTKLSDIATKIANEVSLPSKVDTTSGTFEHVIQASQTDWEFLWRLASRIGYDLYVNGRELHFQKAPTSPPEIPLEWGKELLQFHTRSTTAFQVPEITVRGWDWKKQQAIVGQATNGATSTKIGESRTGTAQAKAAFGNAKLDIVDMPVETQDEAKAVAQSLADAIAGGHIYAEGVTNGGMGDILPGKLVNIKGVGTRFSGKYYVTATRHRYTPQEGYVTTFVVGGSRSDTLAELVDAGPKPAGASGRIQGVVVGVVTNNEDKDDLNRVKVKFPWLMGSDGKEVESGWARIVAPDAGPKRGFQWLPEVNDEILVAFEHGDINRPYILGGLWNGKSKAPLANADAVASGKVKQRIIKSRSGHTIILNDEQNKEQIVIRDKTEKNEVMIDSAKNTLSIKVEKDITIEAKGKITIKTSSGDVSIEGQNITLKAGQKCQIEATSQMNIKGAQTTVEASSQMAVKGAQTSLEGSAMTEVKGGLVKIN